MDPSEIKSSDFATEVFWRTTIRNFEKCPTKMTIKKKTACSLRITIAIRSKISALFWGITATNYSDEKLYLDFGAFEYMSTHSE